METTPWTDPERSEGVGGASPYATRKLLLDYQRIKHVSILGSSSLLVVCFAGAKTMNGEARISSAYVAAGSCICIWRF